MNATFERAKLFVDTLSKQLPTWIRRQLISIGIARWESNWNSTTTYRRGDIVRYNGVLYVVRERCQNITPDESSYYDLFGNQRSIGSFPGFQTLTDFSLLIGAADNLVGYRATFHPTSVFGNITPKDLWNVPIAQFQGHIVNGIVNIALGRGRETQLPGINTLTVTLPDYGSPIVLTWEGAKLRYETIDLTFAQYLQNNVNSTRLLTIEVS